MIDFNKYFKEEEAKLPTQRVENPQNPQQVQQTIQAQRQWMRDKEAGKTNLPLQEYLKTPQKPESPMDMNYVQAMKTVIQPQLDVNKERRLGLEKYKTAEQKRIDEMQNLLTKYRDEAVAGQGEKRQAQTMQATQEAFNREKQYGQLKAGQEKTMLANMAQAGAIGTTGAIDVADIGIEKEYESNIDNIRMTKMKIVNDINDAYITEKNRLERQYINDKDTLNKELSALNKEYDDAIYTLDSSEADMISKIKETAFSRKSEGEAKSKEIIANAFLDQVNRGAYNELGDEAINRKAKEIYGDTPEAEALAYRARVVKGSLTDKTALGIKADEAISKLVGNAQYNRFTAAMAQEMKNRILNGEDALIVLSEYAQKSKTLPKATGGSGTGSLKASDYITADRRVVFFDNQGRAYADGKPYTGEYGMMVKDDYTGDLTFRTLGVVPTVEEVQTTSVLPDGWEGLTPEQKEIYKKLNELQSRQEVLYQQEEQTAADIDKEIKQLNQPWYQNLAENIKDSNAIENAKKNTIPTGGIGGLFRQQ